MLFTEPANIFRGATNDYNVRLLNCKRTYKIKNRHASLRKSYQVKVELISNIKDEMGVNIYDATHCRLHELVLARQVFMTLMRKYTVFSFTQIGDMINKDHSTAMQARNVIQDHYDTDKKFREMYDKIESKIRII